MASEAELRQAVSEGFRAADLLKDPILTGAFDAMQMDFFKAWRQTPLDRPDHRERLYMMFQCIEAVRKQIEQKVQDAVAADAKLKANGLA